MGRKPTGRSSKTVRVPVQYELLVKNYIFGLKQGDALVSVPIELEATVSDDIQPLRMGNLIEPTSEAKSDCRAAIAQASQSIEDIKDRIAKAFDIE